MAAALPAARRGPGAALAGQSVMRLLMAAPVSSSGSSPSVATVLITALRKALRSGSAGFLAGTVQVMAFMWLRTTMNYQYKNGGTFLEVLKKLWAQGGIRRLYQGLFPWAIFQAPLSRFGDVAANDMVLGVTGALFPSLPVSLATFFASMSGAIFRIVITPVDTCKTILQTDGERGMAVLKEKVSKSGITALWAGWEGNYIANVVGNYPWFFTMNYLQRTVRVPEGAIAKLVRSACCGAVASSVSDVVSNSIRVVKTKKQTSEDASTGYVKAAQMIVEKDGIYGVLFRGLETRIFTNVLQGAFFTVVWKAIASGGK